MESSEERRSDHMKLEWALVDKHYEGYLREKAERDGENKAWKSFTAPWDATRMEEGEGTAIIWKHACWPRWVGKDEKIFFSFS